MRLKKNQMKLYTLKKAKSKKNNEGSSYIEFEEPFIVEADIYPAGGKIQAELYGQRLAYMMNMICYENDNIAEGDGVCINSLDEPDYTVVSIQNFQSKKSHMMCVLEKRR